MHNTSNHKPSKWYSIRKSFVLSLCSFLSIILFCAWWYHLPMGTGPAGPPVPDEPFKRIWINSNVLLVGMGDSIITGFGSGGIQYSCFTRLHKTPIDDSENMREKKHQISSSHPPLQRNPRYIPVNFSPDLIRRGLSTTEDNQG